MSHRSAPPPMACRPALPPPLPFVWQCLLRVATSERGAIWADYPAHLSLTIEHWAAGVPIGGPSEVQLGAGYAAVCIKGLWMQRSPRGQLRMMRKVLLTFSALPARL